MRPLVLGFCVSVGIGAAVGAASCASFSSEAPPAAEPDASADAGRGDATTDVELDGVAPGDGGAPTLRLPCPPASAGTLPIEQWRSRKLFAPADTAHRMYPFAIATDSSHVTWLAHPGTADGGDDTEPYNGNDGAAVLRAPKSGAGPVAVLARDQVGARGLVLDDTYAYWAVNEGGGASIRRQRRDVDCNSGCPAPEPMVTLPSGTRVERLLRAAPGVLHALGGNGVLYRYAVGDAISSVVATSGDFPGMTATSTDVFVSSAVVAVVQRAPVLGGSAVTEVSVPGAADARAGVTALATDCVTLWMSRPRIPGGDELQSHVLGMSGSFTPAVSFGQVAEIHDLAMDARYVYAAAFNNGGIFALDTTNGNTSRPYGGNVYNVAVDDDGVYFGEHDRSAPGGAGTLYMLVKQ